MLFILSIGMLVQSPPLSPPRRLVPSQPVKSVINFTLAGDSGLFCPIYPSAVVYMYELVKPVCFHLLKAGVSMLEAMWAAFIIHINLSL